MSVTAFLFWSRYDGERSLGDWLARDAEISPLHRLSLASHARFGNDVTLLSYQPIPNLPEGVTVADAGEYLPPAKAFRFLLSGHQIAHIADYVRLSAASSASGIVLDMDAVALRRLPTEPFFSSMPAKRTGNMAPKWGKSHPPLKVNDGSWDGKALSAFPLGIDTAMVPYIDEIRLHILATLIAPPKQDTKAWNYVMWALKAIPYREPQYAVHPPIRFCPLPAWMGKGNCYSLESPTRCDGRLLFGHPMPTVKEILEQSVVVQHFFESAFKGAETKTDGFWANVPECCLLASEARHVLGDEWRETLKA